MPNTAKSVEEIIAERAGLDPYDRDHGWWPRSAGHQPEATSCRDPFVLPFLSTRRSSPARGGEIADLIEEERAAAASSKRRA